MPLFFPPSLSGQQIVAYPRQEVPRALQHLQVGDTLEVTVDTNKAGEIGVRVHGEFLTASLPKGLQVGDTISVSVRQTEGTVILQLLGKQPLTEGVSATHDISYLEKLFENLLAPGERKGLRLLLNTSRELPTLTRTLREHLFPKERSGSAETTQLLPSSLAQTEAKSTSILQHPSIYETPEKLASFLKELASNNLTPRLAPLVPLIQSFGDRHVGAPISELVTKVERTIARLLTGSESLDFTSSPSSVDSPLPDLVTPIIQIAMRAKSRTALYRIERFSPNPEGNPLLYLLRSLQLLTFPEPSHLSGSEREIAAFLKTLEREIFQLKQSHMGERDVREKLSTAHRQLETEIMAKARPKATEHLDPQTTQSAVRVLEQFMQSHETLRQMNTLMQALGEPCLLLLPLFTNGMLTNLQIQHSPLSKDGSSPRDTKDGYHRCEISFDLPSWGKTEVHIAYRENEALVHIGVSDPSVAQFIQARSGLFEERLSKLGYQRTQISATHGNNTSSQPAWLSSFTDHLHIA